MGVKGDRRNKTVSSYEESDLIVNVKDILKSAESKNWYIDKDIFNIDLQKICADNKVIYIEKEMEDNSISGSLSKNDDNWVISVNKNHHSNRKKFTLAHELGHFFLHKNMKVEFRDEIFFRSSALDSIEYAANEFAAKLLIPESLLRKVINQGEKNIVTLANKFNVSSAAMKYRLVELGYKLKQKKS